MGCPGKPGCHAARKRRGDEMSEHSGSKLAGAHQIEAGQSLSLGLR